MRHDKKCCHSLKLYIDKKEWYVEAVSPELLGDAAFLLQTRNGCNKTCL
jgi:hypothetical protein